MRIWPAAGLLLVLAGACAFERGGVEGGHAAGADGAPGADGPADPPDAASCPLTFVDDCDPGGAQGDWTVGTSEIVDTDTDARCVTVTQTGGPDVCRIHVTRLTVPQGALLRAVGSRPLVVLVDGDAVVAGTVDVGSRRNDTAGAGANDASCAVERTAEDDAGGGAGGAGGSFADTGGAGGEGDTDSSIGPDGTAVGGLPGAATATPTVVRGGCPGASGGSEGGGGGNGGNGGASGGAVVVAALGRLEVTATGVLLATGAGGDPGQVQAGGGGGGSGGLIGLEAPVLVVDGQLSANGGGGGGGGARLGGTPTTGGPGSDGALGTTPAPGGSGTTSVAGEGDGGPGSAGATTAGGEGQPSRGGAGGGGGAAGFTLLVGPAQGSGAYSPPPTQL